jgi:hypothetical protein
MARFALIGQAVYGPSMEQPQFWFNTRTGQVETEEDKGQGKDLMGPYASREEAAQALESARGTRRTAAGARVTSRTEREEGLDGPEGQRCSLGMTSRPKTSIHSAWLRPTLCR